MPWLCWELLFSMLCVSCIGKGSSHDLDVIISGNYVLIMIMLTFIYVYMYVCMYVCHCLIGLSRIMIALY